jgi:sugar fermentation stimulation protein A
MTRQNGTDNSGLAWPHLIRGKLVKRYQRFLADVKLDDGRQVTAHCANSGRMTGCSQSGRPVYLSYHDNPRRKYNYTWELIRMPDAWVGVNTLVPNRLVAHAISNGHLSELNGYEKVMREVTVDSHTRLDLKLSAKGRRDCFIEVKNCTLVEQGHAMFPDAPTIRGQKHLTALERLNKKGARAVIFFLVQRTDAQVFSPADQIDPEYGRLLRRVVKAGVNVLAYDVHIDLKYIAVRRALPIRLSDT